MAFENWALSQSCRQSVYDEGTAVSEIFSFAGFEDGAETAMMKREKILLRSTVMRAVRRRCRWRLKWQAEASI